MKKVVLAVMAAFCFSFIASAAEDATGTWKATFETPNGSQVNTIALKADGTKLTGTIASDMMGSLPISDGKIEEDKISFSITTDFGVIRYAGTIKGDIMKLTLTAGDGQFTLEVNATRVKA